MAEEFHSHHEPISFGIDQILNSPEPASNGLGPKITCWDYQGTNNVYPGGYGSVYSSTSPGGVIRVPARRPIPPAPAQRSPNLCLSGLTFPWIEGHKKLTKERVSAALSPFSIGRRIGHPYQNRTPPKRKKPRTSFSRVQICELEKKFNRQKYLASAERSSLAKSLRMSDSQVKTWFQNRRTKWRRQTAEERESERQQTNRMLLQIQQETIQKSLVQSLSRDPKCTHNSSLCALQNLQPWAEETPNV
ncbi:hypothetical protein GDO86_018712 [Hymenochirus boettgeri]|uniref:Homeobox domain-containing protein n=1 Tax=Hymenochirus boettgeri TaxID=247094 RepID=A0A8T2IHD3_9PIPI|nr:hypothetical protein GDO86_018712 [Hymenochirus boettgeri]